MTEIWTIEELAAYLKVEVPTIYKLRYARKGPPGFKVGRELRFRRVDVDKWWADRLARAS